MDIANVGKWIIFSGMILIAVGFLIWLAAKFGIPVGRLPGDISFKGEKTSFYFPLVTGLAISVILTACINLLIWIFKK